MNISRPLSRPATTAGSTIPPQLSGGPDDAVPILLVDDQPANLDARAHQTGADLVPHRAHARQAGRDSGLPGRRGRLPHQAAGPPDSARQDRGLHRAVPQAPRVVAHEPRAPAADCRATADERRAATLQRGARATCGRTDRGTGRISTPQGRVHRHAGARAAQPSVGVAHGHGGVAPQGERQRRCPIAAGRVRAADSAADPLDQ